MSDASGKTCFVSMPFGVKADHDSGKTVDFDSIYQLIVSPAAHAAGYSTVRADAVSGDGLIDLPNVDLIMTANLFIGDISTHNPKVYYEIGLRHMTSMPCLLIAREDTRMLFAVAGLFQVFRYSEEQDQFSAARDGLAAIISARPHAGYPINKERLRAIISDSSTIPVPTLDVLPHSIQESLTSVERRLYSLETGLSNMVEDIVSKTTGIVSQTTGAPLRKPEEKPSSRRVFVVHGRSDIADSLRTQVCSFLMKLKLEPVVLREQAEGGRALPHKLDEEMSDVEYAFVLLTPDDIGAHRSEEDKLRPRARQNVVYEHGSLCRPLRPATDMCDLDGRCRVA